MTTYEGTAVLYYPAFDGVSTVATTCLVAQSLGTGANNAYAAYFYSADAHAIFANGAGASGAAIFATNLSDGNTIVAYGYGEGFAIIYGESLSEGGYGVYGRSQEESGVGVYGLVSNDYGRAVWGEAGSADGGIGVFGSASGYVSSAGYFVGNVNVDGTLTKSSGGFKIDHPLDPTNRYLVHSFVESPDMKNIYDGVATANESGEFVVDLPGYFTVLNKDFRYQLTALAGPAPELHVKEELKDGRFSVGGAKPGQRVSWQVTGIRQDPWANAMRLVPEEEKPEFEKGFYLHPDLYGKDESFRTPVGRARKKPNEPVRNSQPPKTKAKP